MDFLPLFFQLRGKSCLIIGGGNVALRKASLLCEAGARLYVVAHDICQPLKERAIGSGGDIRRGDYQRSDLQGKHLVVAATDNEQLNTRISRDAHAQQIPVNVVDNPQLCSFIFPSVIDRSPLLVAVSSGGKSPVLTRQLRSKIESFIPFAYGKLATLVGNFRERVKLRFDNPDDRRHFWERILQGPVVEMVLAGKTEAAEQLLTQTLSEPVETPPTGEVYLVGAGPGDPDLLTFKALRLMQQADIVLYDRLVSEPVLELTRRDAHKIYVGKARSSHTFAQHDINQLLVDFAQQGKRVVRLKGGDPFIFGRGGEEIQALARHNIPFQVVPGITAASGCAAYSGIALTHRDYAQSVRFVTGHLKEGQMNLPWQELVHDNQTVVFYMGLMGLPVICQQLINHGQAAHTPAALIQQGTTPQQKVIVGTLATLPGIVASQRVKAPTLIIVGNVVKLHAQLNWFKSKVT